MRNVVTIAAAAALFAGGAYAQYRDRYGYTAPPTYNTPRTNMDVAGRVLEHLDRVQPGSFWDRGEMKQVEHARNDLYRFRDEMARGHYNRGKLDSAIGHLDHLARSNRVPPREREWFQRDVYDLREFRARGSGGRW